MPFGDISHALVPAEPSKAELAISQLKPENQQPRAVAWQIQTERPRLRKLLKLTLAPTEEALAAELERTEAGIPVWDRSLTSLVTLDWSVSPPEVNETFSVHPLPRC